MAILHDDRCTTQTRSLIPSPVEGDESWARFLHQDLPHLSESQLWAEEVIVTAGFAEAIVAHRRPKIIDVDPSGGSITDIEWLRDRLVRLRAERRMRRAVA